jgi:hypothetical protein
VDDRLAQRLEEQLRDAHSTNTDLRERLIKADARDAEANTNKVMARDAEAQLEKAHAKQKAAEDNAAAAQRKCEEAEREAVRARGELEELQTRFNIVKAEADKLNELNARIETAKHAGDLFSA